jgi:hypothetical protein
MGGPERAMVKEMQAIAERGQGFAKDPLEVRT